MRHAVLGALLALALAPALWALDNEQQSTPAEELKALQDEVRKAQQEVAASFKEAKPEEKEAIIKKFRTMPEKYAGRFLDLAQKHAKDKVGHDAAVWILTQVQAGSEPDKAADILVQHHADKLTAVARMLSRSTSAGAEKILRASVDAAKEPAAQAQAKLGLAVHFKNRSETDAKYGTEAEKLFEEIVAKHADQAAIAKTAKSELHELRHLSVGKVSPDIIGEDIDGQKFKLSDYRGKVVLLDFWGHW